MGFKVVAKPTTVSVLLLASLIRLESCSPTTEQFAQSGNVAFLMVEFGNGYIQVLRSGRGSGQMKDGMPGMEEGIEVEFWPIW
jgi:hypothetical protein